ncbi:MAG: hypothetical protein NPIRA04_10640 [Nitrospirales bacterium]|nr:MAG: hypothetical protein NPIRA04_10640 [Nitrospirales bacterium]
MRNPLRLGCLALAFITTLTLALPAAAAPIPVLYWMQLIRQGFGDQVKVIGDYEYANEKENTIINVNSVKLIVVDQNKKEQTILSLPIKDNMVTKDQLDKTFLTLMNAQTLKLGKKTPEELASLFKFWSYSESPNSQIVEFEFGRFNLKVLPTIEDTISIFNDSGVELAEIEGGSEASTGQIYDGMVEAVLEQSNKRSSQTLEELFSNSTESVNKLTKAQVKWSEPMWKEYPKEFPSEDYTPDSKERAELDYYYKERLFQELWGISQKKGFWGNKKLEMTKQDLTKLIITNSSLDLALFETKKETDNTYSLVLMNSISDDSSKEEVMATLTDLPKARFGKDKISGEFVLSLLRQIGSKMTEAHKLREEFSSTEVYQGIEDVNKAVDTVIDEQKKDDPKKDPDGPDDPGGGEGK